MGVVTRNFTAGKMNKSVDERLVPNGEYIDALNVTLGLTSDSDIGIVENIKGNTKLTTLRYTNGAVLSTSARCIGAIADSTKETIYWFVHDPAFTGVGGSRKLDMIVSINVNTNTLTYHVVSIGQKVLTTPTLNFNPDYLITGVNLVDNFLFFTDNYNPPRVIDVKKNYPYPLIEVDQFIEEDILVIKKPPVEAPYVIPFATTAQDNFMEERLLCFAYRYRYSNNQYSAISQFSDPAFVPNEFEFDYKSFLNDGMTNSCNATIVRYNSGGPLVEGVDLLFKEAGTNIIKVIEKIDKVNSGLIDDTDYDYTFTNSKIFTILPEYELLRQYDNVPLLAEAQTVMGNRLVYGNYTEGYDLIDINDNSISLDYYTELVSEEIATDAEKSLHSNRGYEVGIVYMDEYLRASTALVSPNNTVHVDCSDSDTKNHIKITIPITQRAPYWAKKYKFVIKPDRENYQTIYSNIFFDDPVSKSTYFLLEGENSSKVEEGDRLIVKADTNGPVESCTYATVLEKSAQIEDFITISGIDYIPSGVYMKINTSDFAASQDDISTFTAGTIQTDVNTPGDFPIQQYPVNEVLPGDTFYTDFAIPAGSVISLSFQFKRTGQTLPVECRKRIYTLEKTLISTANYANVYDWFVGDSIESHLNDGVSEYDPDDPEISNVFISTMASSATDIPTDPYTNFYRFYRNPVTNALVLLMSGTNRCAGTIYESKLRSSIIGNINIISTSTTIVFETEPNDSLPDVFFENEESYDIGPDGEHLSYLNTDQDQNFNTSSPAILNTRFFNCYAFGNGVESYKIRDSISGKWFNFGNRVTTTSAQDYKSTNRIADLTYSGVYNDGSNVNKFNEFNAGLANYKHLEDSFGPIHIIDGRETDILVLQEDKISYVLTGKNLLSDAAAGGTITSVPEVLGTQIARVENYGISHNPESYVAWGYDRYFTDAKRGVVLQIKGNSYDAPIVISDFGMHNWFRDLYTDSFKTQKIGGYDPFSNEYVLSSNDIVIPENEECYACGIAKTYYVNLGDTVTFCNDLKNVVGVVTVTYNVLSIDPATTIVIESTYDGVTTTVDDIVTSDSFTFTKDSIEEKTSEITISTVGGNAVVEMIISCPAPIEINIVTICLTNDYQSGKFIRNEYRFTDGTYVSPTQTENVLFDYGTENPLVSSYVLATGSQGYGSFPTEGSTVRMSCIKTGYNDFQFYPATDKFRYYRSDILYPNTEAAMRVLLAASTVATPISPLTTGQDEYSSSFVLGSTGDYIYLIYDYRDSIPQSLCYSNVSAEDASCNCCVETCTVWQIENVLGTESVFEYTDCGTGDVIEITLDGLELVGGVTTRTIPILISGELTITETGCGAPA